MQQPTMGPVQQPGQQTSIQGQLSPYPPPQGLSTTTIVQQTSAHALQPFTNNPQASSFKTYTLVETPELVERVCRDILTCYPPPVLGLDCEGLIKGKPIALLQLSFQDHSYVFDLQKVDPFYHGLACNLKQILTSVHIIKIFHDFCEDCSALINQHGIYCNSVFDTQIAHRVISTATQNLGNGSNENQIGLNTLLQKYLGAEVQNTNKKAISKQMKLDDTFWHTVRPLSEQMLEYAAQDVIFLPMVYEKMQAYFVVPWVERHCNSRGEMTFENTTVLTKIFNDTKKCLQYATINNDVRDLSSLQMGREIVAFIKNYRKDVIFCSLNLGYSGVIRDPASRNTLEKFNSFGDLVYVTLHRIEHHKGQAVLSFSRQFSTNDRLPQYQAQYTTTTTVGVPQAASQQVQTFHASAHPFVPTGLHPVMVHQAPLTMQTTTAYQQQGTTTIQGAPTAVYHSSQPAPIQIQVIHKTTTTGPRPPVMVHTQPQYSHIQAQAAQQQLQQPQQQAQQQQQQQRQQQITVAFENPTSAQAAEITATNGHLGQSSAIPSFVPSDHLSKSFRQSLTISEPEAEQSLNHDTSMISEDSLKNMNLKASAFVPTPKSSNKGNKSGSSGHPHPIYFVPKNDQGGQAQASNYRQFNSQQTKPSQSAKACAALAHTVGYMPDLDYIQNNNFSDSGKYEIPRTVKNQEYFAKKGLAEASQAKTSSGGQKPSVAASGAELARSLKQPKPIGLNSSMSGSNYQSGGGHKRKNQRFQQRANKKAQLQSVQQITIPFNGDFLETRPPSSKTSQSRHESFAQEGGISMTPTNDKATKASASASSKHHQQLLAKMSAGAHESHSSIRVVTKKDASGI